MFGWCKGWRERTKIVGIELKHVRYCPSCKTTLRVIKKDGFGADLFCNHCEVAWNISYGDMGQMLSTLNLQVLRAELPPSMKARIDY